MLSVLCVSAAFAQHAHDHGQEPTKAVARPRVFLDKSPRVVAYQLKRLDNERLLLVDRHTNDPKYAPVYQAILLRAGMSPQYREEALDALVTMNKSSATDEVLAAIDSLDPNDRQQHRSGRELASLLLNAESSSLAESAAAFVSATQSSNQLVRAVGFAGLITALEGDRAMSLAEENAAKVALFDAISMVPQAGARNAMRGQAMELVNSDSADVRQAAITALGFMSARQDETFVKLAPLVSNPSFRTPAVRTMLKIPSAERDSETAAALVRTLVELAEQTPASERTTDEFVDAMQLADQLFARIPVELARSYRKRLRDVTVRVVQIHTIVEEMRYDTAFFAVEAGRPLQVVLKNEDLMPHNLVVVTPGSLQEVAELGLAVGPQAGFEGKQYVPVSEKVMHATHMVAPGKQERITFTAPTEPGEYPYVCTFPRHWMRMYGVMIVVEDLDAWLKNPTEPKDPIGSNRAFVQSWKLDDLKDELDQGLRGRSLEIGKRIFTEATCAQCHQIKGEGGAVGPELTDVFKRWKGDRLSVLSEILEPSHRIDPKYAVHLVITADGNTISGIVATEDNELVSLITNPESKEVTVIDRDEIEEMVQTSTSLMPKGLLDRFTKDEIFELVAYLESL